MRDASEPRGGGVLSSQTFEMVYDELRRLAAFALSNERAGHTLQPTALVHETWLKLGERFLKTHDRDHLVALAACAMRQVLTDHARRHKAKKRGGDARRVTLHDGHEPAIPWEVDLVELGDSLDRLAQEHERPCRVFELHVFGGLTHEQTARMLDVSEVTVKRDWRLAQAWMLRELSGDGVDG
ncbi:MAG: ECF-type sigma factor [Phycisphaerales bacterium]